MSEREENGVKDEIADEITAETTQDVDATSSEVNAADTADTADTAEPVETQADAMTFTLVFEDEEDDASDAVHSDDTDDISAIETDAEAIADAADVMPQDGAAAVAENNARRVNETLGLAVADDETGIVNATDMTEATDAAEAADTEAQTETEVATTLASRIDRKLGANRSGEVKIKAYPTYALSKVTVTDRKSGRTLLDNVDMACHAGRTHAVLVADDDRALHETVMAVLAGFRRPDSGAVMSKSANIIEFEQIELRGHRLGLIPQRLDFALRDEMDAESNVLNAMDASNRTFLKPKPVIARELLTQVGFADATTGVKAKSLTTLERRRLAIARAICCEAEVIIADEPLTGLADDEERTEIMALLTSLTTGDPKRCVIIVTSDAELADACDVSFAL